MFQRSCGVDVHTPLGLSLCLCSSEMSRWSNQITSSKYSKFTVGQGICTRQSQTYNLRRFSILAHKDKNSGASWKILGYRTSNQSWRAQYRRPLGWREPFSDYASRSTAVLVGTDHRVRLAGSSPITQYEKDPCSTRSALHIL